MKHRRAPALSVIGAMALSLACATPRDGELTGQVFVMTRGAENIKLALVPVNVYPEDVLQSHVEKRRAQCQAELVDARQAIKEAEASDPDFKKRLFDAAYGKRYDALKDRAKWLTSGACYMEGLASGPPTAKTDADGKFTLQMPRAGRMGLAAAARRTLPDGSQENYYWLVWVTLNGKPTGQVMLSNDNLWGQTSADAVVTVECQAIKH